MDEEERDLATCYPTMHNSVEIFAAITGKSCERKEQEEEKEVCSK